MIIIADLSSNCPLFPTCHVKRILKKCLFGSKKKVEIKVKNSGKI